MNFSLSTCTTVNHGISQHTLNSVLVFAKNLIWDIHIDIPVDWSKETIGNKRLDAAKKIQTEFVFCLDSDDVLCNRFPIDVMSSVSDKYDAFVFNSLEHNGKEKILMNDRGASQAATHRVMFRTKFLINMLEELIVTDYVKEDIYMMWYTLEHGRVGYFPYPIIKRIGQPRCVLFEPYIQRRNKEKPLWNNIFDENRTDYNQLLINNTLATKPEATTSSATNKKKKNADNDFLTSKKIIKVNPSKPQMFKRDEEEIVLPNIISSTEPIIEENVEENISIRHEDNMTAHVCIPIIFPDNGFNDELLYALRSWDKYFHHDKYDITIIGNWKPDWLNENEVEFIPYNDDLSLRRAKNQAIKMEMLLDKYPSILWTNDDIYLLKQVNLEYIIGNWYHEDMNKLNRPYQYKLTPWGKYLWSTYDRAKELSQYGWNCELHIPYYYVRDGFIETQQNYTIMDGDQLARTAYMNQLNYDKNVKIKQFSDVTGLAGGSTNFNPIFEKSVSYMFHDNTILKNKDKRELLINFLKAEFPEKCRFEKGGGYFWQQK